MGSAGAIDADGLLELGRYLLARRYHFTTPTPATHARVNARPGNLVAHDLCGVLGWSRLFSSDGALSELLALMHRAGIASPATRPHEGLWRSSLRASTLGGHLYFHSAYPTEHDDAVFFGPDTYRFVRALQAPCSQAPRRIIDIGSGAGPAAICLARRFPQAEMVAADINPQALLLARVNATLAGAANLQVRHSDVLDGVDGQFDLIVCNPPYMADDNADDQANDKADDEADNKADDNVGRRRRAYRDGGDRLGAGLSERIVLQAIGRLAPGGQLRLYTGSAIVDGRDALRERTGAMLDRAGLDWIYEEIDPDVFGEELARPAYAHAERIAAVMLTATLAAR